MDPRSRLVTVWRPPRPRAVVLALHGGASRPGATAVSPVQPSVLRMVPTALRVAAAAPRRLAVLRLLNSARGWDEHRTPVQDVAWALEEVASRFGADVPVALVGHSLGGRAALLSAGAPAVRAVVALAPWVYDDDADQLDVRGTPVLVVHGTDDQVASPSRAQAVAGRLARTTDARFVSVREAGHAMLKRGALVDGLAADFVATTVLGRRPGRLLGRVLDSETSLTL